MIHDIGDESFSCIRAVHNEQSQLDPDSSVEYLGQNSSPRSSALRHLALAQAKLLEAQEKPKSEDIRFLPDLRQDTSQVLVAATAPYCRRRINFRKSLTPPHQAFSTSSAVREATPRDLDWDDPVLNPSVRTTSPSPSSQSSDLPDLPGLPKTRSEAPSIKSQACLVDPRKARGAANANKTSSWSVHAAPVKKAKFTWTRAEKGVRDRKKQEQQELLRSKHRTCSYDCSSGVPPKVWYYRSLPSGEVRFMGRDTRLGFVTSPSKDLQSVLDELKGYITSAIVLLWEGLSDNAAGLQASWMGFRMGNAVLE